MATPPDDKLELVADAEPQIDPQAVALHEANTKAIELDQLQEKLESFRQDREQRKEYSDLLFALISIWLASIGSVVVMNGFEHIPFNLTDTVLVTLIGSTTASVLGLFAIVANYLFPKR